MRDLPPDSHSGPVLGLFANEAELRDHLAVRLDLIEPGLTLIKTEYVLANPDGSGGRIDILARDVFDHLVCIEVKRSDRSARETLNELSKYLTLLVERDRVPREMIRCMVVSTHWQELFLPLSYFAVASGVDVTGYRAVAEEGVLVLEREPLKELRFLPQLSPDMDFIWFDDGATRSRHIEHIRNRSTDLPFVRLALLLFEPIPARRTDRPAFPMVVCVWRVPDGLHDRIEGVTGKPIGADFPYAAEGWDAESDAKDWICDVPHEELPEVAHGWQHGTPEMLQSLVANYSLRSVERVGDWPKLEFINDDARILTAALADSPLGGTERPNRNRYQAVVTPAVASSWKLAVDGFLAFIAFEPAWHSAAAGYLATLTGDVSVELHAFDKKHLVYAIHQARVHEETSLGFFEIIVREEGDVQGGMHGHYVWDGRTCPSDAEAAIEAIYGDITWARMSIGSAVDQQRYEGALPLHGFIPVVDRLYEADRMIFGEPIERHTIRDFFLARPDYSRQVSEVLERLGPLPTDPTG